jgi:hypothetical protein
VAKVFQQQSGGYSCCIGKGDLLDCGFFPGAVIDTLPGIESLTPEGSSTALRVNPE